ncbi:MAG: HAMP domain-containing histidine kinase [Acidobacteria bacterium]|nr:HAMP domain-containing histidine kinase [Acidobacteriota bacterium]
MRRIGIPRYVRWYLPGAGLALLLALLGLLQYRANRELRDDLGHEMRAQARTSLMRVRRGLEDELGVICDAFQASQSNFQASPSNAPGDDFRKAAVSLGRFRQTSAHPWLVANVFVFEGARGTGELLELHSEQQQFERVEWPPNLIPLREHLERLAAEMPPPAGREVRPPDRYRPLARRRPWLWLMDQNVPALVRVARGPGALSAVIIELNTQVLAESILPQLVEREFVSNGKSPYRVALLNGNEPGAVLYTSDPGFGSGSLTPDVELNVFGPPMVSYGSARGRDSGGEPAPWIVQAGDIEARIRGPRPDGGTRLEAAAEPPPPRIGPIRYAARSRGWALVAQHRKGSVEAAVAALFHRNLTIDFGVLLVLASMIAMIAISARRAERLAELQLDFVARVSHELRTPLTGIISSAENVADGIVTGKERAQRYGEAILGQAQQLAELIEEILLFSATERGPSYNFEWFGVSKLIRASLESTSAPLRAAGVRVDQHIDPDLPEVRGDFKALTRCLQNLIVNAIKYGGDARWIGIRATLEESSSSLSEVVIKVEDKGLGISRDELKKIFHPFYRSPAVKADQIHGSGLGLAIVKRIMEAMGGRLAVQSELGKGSCFSVYLPAESKPSPGGPVSVTLPVEAAGTR